MENYLSPLLLMFSCVQFTAAYNFLRNFLYDLRTKMFHAAVTEQDFYEVCSVYNHIVKCK